MTIVLGGKQGRNAIGRMESYRHSITKARKVRKIKSTNNCVHIYTNEINSLYTYNCAL